MKLLLYCTKAKPYLIHESGCYDSEDMCCDYDCFSVVDRQELYNQDISLDKTYNGKIVAECDYEVEEIRYGWYPQNIVLKGDHYYTYYKTSKIEPKEFYKKSCLNWEQLNSYLNDCDSQKFEGGYAIHIKNLHIFDEPRELSEVYKIEDVGGMLFTKPLTKAPQNMMRVSVKHWDYAIYNPDDIRILISIQSQWLCKILNKEKTIEVRKKVLKEML